MLKLAVAQDQSTPASVRFYRTTGPLSFLEKQYPKFRIDYKPAQYFLSHEMHVFPYDVVLVERPITQTAWEIVKTCKSMGVLAWVDMDDNLFQIPDYNNSQDYFSIPQNMQLVQNILGIADLITVSTPHLHKLYSGVNQNCVVVPNAWCDYRFPFPEVSTINKPVKIAWRGGNKHDGDLFEVKGPLSIALQEPAFDWMFYGGRPHFFNINRSNYRPFSGLFSYFKDFILSGTDFLFVPLQVNDFNRSKSNCSWIEATLAGAVTIAPMGLSEFDQPGVIRYKDNAHLKRIFSDIKKGKYDKLERVEASRAALFENFRLSQVNAMRKELLESFFKVNQKVEENASS